jgi:hypothetical protein
MDSADVRQQMGLHAAKNRADEKAVWEQLYQMFESSPLPIAMRFQAFARHMRRQDLARFLAKYELYKLSLSAAGSVVECGVFAGGGLLAWAHFSAILEPYNHNRRVIGFDTFEGFPGVHAKDAEHGSSEHLRAGAFETHASIRAEIEALAALHDRNRPLGHIPKIELVAGDACQTIPQYIEQNPHLLISLIYLDFDLYEPTRVALQTLLPRVVAGGVVAFDELNCADFPGETLALLEATDLRGARLRRFPFDPYIAYFVKGD